MNIRVLYAKLCSAYWETRLGIRTTGMGRILPESESHAYQTLNYPEIFRILKNLSLDRNDVFVDLGCGKGRVVCCASQFGIAGVVGVELDRTLAGIADSNAKAVRRRRAPITIRNEGAESFDYRQGTVFYLFNPFGASTLSVVLKALREGIEANKRAVRIIYANPAHQSLLAQADWLRCDDVWQKIPSRDMTVSFWSCDLP